MARERSRIVRTAGTLLAILATGLITWIAASYRADIAAARARIATGSEIAQTPCGPIEYAAVVSTLPRYELEKITTASMRMGRHG